MYSFERSLIPLGVLIRHLKFPEFDFVDRRDSREWFGQLDLTPKSRTRDLLRNNPDRG